MRVYKTRFAILFFFLFALPAALFAFGRQDKKIRTVYNQNWTLNITQFDVSAMPPSQAAIGGVVTRSLASRFSGMSTKLRKGGEYDYYWNVAWQNAQSEIAKKIVEKQAERDKLLYQGEAEWKQNIKRKKIDDEIETLRLSLENISFESPDISKAPAFLISDDNKKNIFPAPPKAGGEYALCTEKKADALLFGKVSLFHGRILVELSLWTVWKRGISYTDKIVFSIEDIDLALDEFIARLITSISEMQSAIITVQAKPKEAVIIIGDHHAGRGKSELVDRTPGTVDITVYAENHITAKETIELNSAELTEVEVELRPIPTGSVTVGIDTNTKKSKKSAPNREQEQNETAPSGSEEGGGAAALEEAAQSEEAQVKTDEPPPQAAAAAAEDAASSGAENPAEADVAVPGTKDLFGESASVYEGALWVGAAPLTIPGKLNGIKHISVETEDGRAAQTLFQIKEGVGETLLKPHIPAVPGRTEKARKKFYGAWGRFWVMLSLALFSAGLSNVEANSFNYAPAYSKSQEKLDRANLWYNISMGTWIAWGVSFIDVIVRLCIYIYQGNREGSIISPKAELKPAVANETPAALPPPSTAPPAPVIDR